MMLLLTIKLKSRYVFSVKCIRHHRVHRPRRVHHISISQRVANELSISQPKVSSHTVGYDISRLLEADDSRNCDRSNGHRTGSDAQETTLRSRGVYTRNIKISETEPTTV